MDPLLRSWLQLLALTLATTLLSGVEGRLAENRLRSGDILYQREES